MKIRWFLLVGVLVWGIAWANGDSNETFALNKGQIRISIEHLYQRQGLTPVVLSLGDLQIIGMMDDSGRVFGDEFDARRPSAGSLCTVDGPGKTVAIGRETSQAIVYEQNPIRTRLRLVRQDIPVILELDFEKGKGELRLGESRLLLTIHSEEKSLGVYKIRLLSPAIMLITPLLYLPSTGTIHRTDVSVSGMDPAAYPLWARRLNEGESR